MLTIGRLAEYAGVSVRAVRHYHQIGLLPEPPRDSSGYRRYGSEHVVRLVRIRTLTAAGVPLTRVGELLDADPDGFADALGEVDDQLRAKISALQEHRRRLATLTDPDAGSLGPRARDVLAVLTELGVSERFLEIEREAALLMAVLHPQRAEEWMAWQLEALADPEVQELYRLSNEAEEWDPDDPRVEDLARRSVAITAKHFPADSSAHDWWTEIDATSYRLIDQHGTETSAVWARLTERVGELMLEAGYRLPDPPR